MRRLGDALVLWLADVSPAQDDQGGAMLESPDGRHNRRWAERKLRRARSRTTRPLVTVADIYRALGHGCRLCHDCHTPILAGCRIDGRWVNRARAFCGAPCKMRWRRRKRAATQRGPESIHANQ